MIVVHLPRALGERVGCPKTLELDESGLGDLGALIRHLDGRFPGIWSAFTEADGALRPHLAVYVGRQDARQSGGLNTPLEAGADVWFLEAVSGG